LFLAHAEPEWLTRKLPRHHHRLGWTLSNNTEKPLPLQVAPQEHKGETADVQRDEWKRSQPAS
jgi:hypothetical protein